MPSYYVTDTTLSSRFPIDTRANVGEVFPDPVTTNATRRIPDGARVRIDGGTGLVEVL